MASSAVRYKQLKKELSNLQKIADNQKYHYKSSKVLLYEGLSRVYILWAEANKEEGLLEKLYKEYNLQYKTQTKYDIQFSPLLRYLWNLDGTVNSNTIDQWNRALNNIHTEVQLNKQYYKTSTLNKLIMLISDKGGISALAGYGKNDSDKESNSISPKKQSKEIVQKLKDAHLNEGKKYFSSSTPIAQIKTPKTLVSADSGLTLALLRKTENGYEVISAVDDKALVEQTIVTAYKRTSKQMPHTIRLLTEIIRSQALPAKISKLAPSLVDISNFKDVGVKVASKKLKRVLYVASKQEFILSENRSACSVVTVVSPISPIFTKKVKEDLALAVIDRTYIENNLIHSDDFNFYTTDAKRYVPETTDEVASYKLKLVNTVTNAFRFIRFYHLSTYNSIHSKKQAIIKSGIKFKPKYKAILDYSWISEMSALFLSPFVNGFGTKMKRAEYKIIELMLLKASIEFKFVFKANEFKESEIISFGRRTADKGAINVKVLSKDIIPVLNALVTMEVDGNVMIYADDKMLQFKFTTECAEYSIYVPCCNEKAKRFDDYFEAYGA